MYIKSHYHYGCHWQDQFVKLNKNHFQQGANEMKIYENFVFTYLEFKSKIQ